MQLIECQSTFTNEVLDNVDKSTVSSCNL